MAPGAVVPRVAERIESRAEAALMSRFSRAAAIGVARVCALATGRAQQSAPHTPDQFFGFHVGADGELARYPKIVEYLQHLAATTNRVRFQELGKTTMGNPYVLATISAPENLAKLNRLIEINRRLADPRGLDEAEANRLAQEARASYFISGTTHSTEIRNTQPPSEL